MLRLGAVAEAALAVGLPDTCAIAFVSVAWLAERSGLPLLVGALRLPAATIPTVRLLYTTFSSVSRLGKCVSTNFCRSVSIVVFLCLM